eukprot:COSAG05_NODE_639_length_8156_cov_122.162840_10_plen_103_part_00
MVSQFPIILKQHLDSSVAGKPHLRARTCAAAFSHQRIAASGSGDNPAMPCSIASALQLIRHSLKHALLRFTYRENARISDHDDEGGEGQEQGADAEAQCARQ